MLLPSEKVEVLKAVLESSHILIIIAYVDMLYVYKVLAASTAQCKVNNNQCFWLDEESNDYQKMTDNKNK